MLEEKRNITEKHKHPTRTDCIINPEANYNFQL